MNKLIRYWNQNRLRIIITVLIIAFIIIIIQVINSILENSRKTLESENKIIKDTSRPSESVISGEKIPEKETDKNVDIIEQFVYFNNKKEYENAYNLLTDECKEEVFNNDINKYVTEYFNNIFNIKKTYNLELWHYTADTYTYRISYVDDNILATGEFNTNNGIEDYITVVEKNNNRQLNISYFIEKRNINKGVNDSGISIKVSDRFMYKDYEEITFTIRNNTDKTILLSEGINSNDICLIDNNKYEYNSMINEIPLDYFELQPGVERTINIKFYKIYNLYRTVDKIYFKNIIMDKEMYQTNSDNVNKKKIEINI